MYVYRQKPSFSILATLHADTPKDDLSNDENLFLSANVISQGSLHCSLRSKLQQYV